jgi:type IV secretory pathway VirB4 component
MIAADRIAFHRTKPRLRFTNGDRVVHARIVTVRTWGEAIDEYMTLQLARLPSQSMITQIMKPFRDGNPLKVRAAMALKRDRSSMISTDRGAVKDQFNAVLADLANESDTSYTVWDHHTVITFYDRDEAQLARTIKLAEQICGDKFANLVQEGTAQLATWLHQLPCFPGPWPRLWLHNSLQLACCLPFDSAPPGQADCDWGKGALLRLLTIGGSIFNFQLHVQPPKEGDKRLAHGIVIGPAGSGKSTFIAMLLMASLRFPRHRVFVFDSERGMEIATFAAGGHQIRFDETSLRLNPLDCEGTHEERAFIRAWLKKITNTAADDNPTLREIADLVAGAFDMIPRNLRTLRSATEAHLISDRPGGLRERLRPWVGDDWQGRLFNAREDKLSALTTRWVTFDFTTLYEHGPVAKAVITYLTHKIRYILMSRNESAIIFIDEAHKILDGDVDMAKWFKAMLRGYRKLAVAVIAAFQDTSVIRDLGLGPVLRTNAPTTVFFPNPQSSQEDITEWRYTDRETDFMVDGWGFERAVLLKRYHAQNQESVILNIDFSYLRGLPEGDLLRTLAADEDSRARLRAALEAAKDAGYTGEALREAAILRFAARDIIPALTNQRNAA